MKTIYNTLTQTPLKNIISLDKFSTVAKLRDPYHLTQLVAAEESENTSPNRITLANIKLAVQAYYDLILELSESSDPSNTLSQYKKQLPANYIPNDSMFNAYLDILDTLDNYISEKLELLESEQKNNTVIKKSANINLISGPISRNPQPEIISEPRKGLNMHVEPEQSTKKPLPKADKPVKSSVSKSSQHDNISTGLDRFRQESKKVDFNPLDERSTQQAIDRLNRKKHIDPLESKKSSLQDRITAFLTGK